MITHCTLLSFFVIVPSFSYLIPARFNILSNRQYTSFKNINRLSKSGNNAGVATIEDIREDLDKYLSLIKNNTTAPAKIKIEKKENPLEMLRPTGWYRDETEFELKSRCDPRIAEDLHPLSYVELKRFGFEHLIEDVMNLGGPIEVGRKIGIEWVEPVRKKVEYEQKPIPYDEMDYTGSLTLGGSLEEKLAAAANLDVEMLKETIKNRPSAQLNVSESDGPDYTKFKSSKKVIVEPSVPYGESFKLNGQQKLNFVLICSTLSVGYGRASGDIISLNKWGNIGPDIIEITGNIAIVLLASTVVSCFYAILISKEKNRNSLVWCLKSAIGGPSSVLELRKLEAL